jgi:hypothetical protein
MRQRCHLLIALLSIMTAIIISGCSSARKDNPSATPKPLPKLAADTITQATNYGGALLGQIGALNSVMGRYQDLLKNPRLAERDWQLLVNSQNLAIDLTYEGISSLTPPEPLKDFHAAAVDAAGNCLAARKTVQAAMDAMDANQLGQAAQQAERCVSALEQVESELRAIAANNNITLTELPLTGALGGAAEEEPAPASNATSVTGTVNEAANLRAGPGTNYNKIGGLQKGVSVSVIGRNEAGDWFVVQTQNIPQAWIAAFLVNGVSDVRSLPVVRAPP